MGMQVSCGSLGSADGVNGGGTMPKVLCDPNDNGHLRHLAGIAGRDAQGLIAAHKHYGNSWKKRGGVSAFMMLCRKWDRLEKFLEEHGWDIFKAMDADTRGEGIIDDIRDLRRYLLLVEAEARARGIECAQATHRDNIAETAQAAEERYSKTKPFSVLRDQLHTGGVILPKGCPSAPVIGEGGHETVVNVDGHLVEKGGPDDDHTWHPDREAPDRRVSGDDHAGRAVILEDRDPGPSGSVSDPSGRA